MSDERNVTLSQTSRRRLLRAVGGLTTLSVASGVTIDTVAAEPGDQRWAFDADGGEFRSAPTVMDNTVYATDGYTLYAIAAETGYQQWAFDADGGEFRSAPTVVDNTVYATDGYTLYAIAAETGYQQWAFKAGYDIYSSPTVVDGTVYVGSGDSNLYAVSAADGTQQWSFETGDEVRSSPTVVDGTAYVGSTDDNLYAVDATTGDQQWIFDTGGQVRSSPTVVDGTVFVGRFDANAYVINGDEVYDRNDDRNLYAVDAADGTQQWVFKTGKYGTIDSSPTVLNGSVYVGSADNNLYAVDATTGDQQWALETGAGVYSSPTVVDETVYVGSDDNNLYAVDAADGTRQWVFETNDRVRSSPMVVDGTVYVGSDDGSLYALDTDVNGSSEGSRVMLGTIGHHGEWRYAGQSVNMSITTQVLPWVRNNLALTVGGVGGVIGGSYLLRRRQQPTGRAQTETAKQTSNDSGSGTAEVDDQSTTASEEPTADSESRTDRHRTAAEKAIETAFTAKLNENHDEAVDAYSRAISEYQTALDTLNAGTTDQRDEIEAAIESTRDDLKGVKLRRKERNETIEAIKPAERSLQEAIVAYIEDDQTVARIRFRQARDTFKHAHKTIVETEDDLLPEPVEVTIQPNREPSTTTLSELSVIPEAAATALADAGIETVNDLDGIDESTWRPTAVEELVADDSIDEDVATTLTLLSWWHGDESYTFETAEAVERRQQQADYGFNQSS